MGRSQGENGRVHLLPSLPGAGLHRPEVFSIFYLAADLQVPEMFLIRKPLSDAARRAGWQGFTYNLRLVRDRFVRLL